MGGKCQIRLLFIRGKAISEGTVIMVQFPLLINQSMSILLK